MQWQKGGGGFALAKKYIVAHVHEVYLFLLVFLMHPKHLILLTVRFYLIERDFSVHLTSFLLPVTRVSKCLSDGRLHSHSFPMHATRWCYSLHSVHHLQWWFIDDCVTWVLGLSLYWSIRLCYFASLLTCLFQIYCLPLYASALSSLSCSALYHVEIAFNKVLRMIWQLPGQSHNSIVHCVANLDSLYNLVCLHYTLKWPSILVHTLFCHSSCASCSFCAYNGA